MNLNTLVSLPKEFYVAFSGGVDSSVIVHRALNQKRKITLAFYNHGNDISAEEESFVDYFAKHHRLTLVKGYCQEDQTGSKEKFWRDSRYNFFKELPGHVVTGHHLDDAVVWYLMTCIRGEGQYMPYAHANVIRPFLTVKKEDILEYARVNNIEYFQDPTNTDPDFTQRNHVVLNILPEVLKINPGLYSTVENKIRSRQRAVDSFDK